MTDRYASAPFGSVNCSYPEGNGIPELKITNPGGGILGGDHLQIEVTLAPGASASISTQGATKAYRGERSYQNSLFEAGEDSYLEYLPHHLIPFADSNHAQVTQFRFHGEASALTWEAFSAGRVARGERFAFESLHARMRLYRGDRLEAVDGFELTGGTEHFGGYSYLGNAFAVVPDAPQLAGELDGLLERVRNQPGEQRRSKGALAAASAPTGRLCMVRVLSCTAEDLYSALNLLVAPVRRMVGVFSDGRGGRGG